MKIYSKFVNKKPVGVTVSTVNKGQWPLLWAAEVTGLNTGFKAVEGQEYLKGSLDGLSELTTGVQDV
jgi:hypothetical protein